MLKRILLGLTNLPGYGSHPGWAVLIGFTLAAMFIQGLVGLGLVAVLILPLFLVGAYGRGNDYLRDLELSRGSSAVERRSLRPEGTGSIPVRALDSTDDLHARDGSPPRRQS